MYQSAGVAGVSPETGFLFMMIVGGWILMAITVALAAMERKRPFFNWFVVSLLFSPFFAVLLLIAAGDGDELRDEQRALLRKIAVAAKGADDKKPSNSQPQLTPSRHEKMMSERINFTADDVSRFSDTRDRPVSGS